MVELKYSCHLTIFAMRIISETTEALENFMAKTDDERPRGSGWKVLLSGILTGYVLLMGVYFLFLR
jgi:hypothetical protein